MTHSVFVDKIGGLFCGGFAESKKSYEQYREMSELGVGIFGGKNVYLLDESGKILSSFGTTKMFRDGGDVVGSSFLDVIKKYFLGADISSDLIGDSGMTYIKGDNRTLFMKHRGIDYKFIEKKGNDFKIYKSSFPDTSYFSSLVKSAGSYALKNFLSLKVE